MMMSVDPHTLPGSKSPRIVASLVALLCLALAVWMGYDMYQLQVAEKLWGWRPFFFLSGLWGAILAFVLGMIWNDRVRRRRWLLSTLSGVLLSLAFPPSPLTPLVFVALVPLLMTEQSIVREFGRVRRGRVLWQAFNTFLIWNIGATWWIMNTSFLPAIVANVANATLLAAVFVIYHQARSVLDPHLHPIALAAFWIAFEYLHMQWEISWPWLTFGNVTSEYPSWIQWYEYTGVFGGSLWILLANYWIYRWIVQKERSRRMLVGIALWLCIPAGWSLWRYFTYPLEEGSIEIVVVQPNFEPHYEKFRISQEKQLKRFIELSESALTDSTAYLVFPETSFGYLNLSEMESDSRIHALREVIAVHPNLKIITGLETFRIHAERNALRSLREITGRDGQTMFVDVQNSAIELEADDETEVYFKSKLVPGAEHFPFREFLPFLKPIVDMLQGSVAGLTTQKTRTVFRSESGNAAPVICYESVYGEFVGGYVRNGATIIFIVTNDGWWDKTPGHIQHLKIGALRAIEHRRPIARSANTGISCFINQRGDVIQPTAYRETTAIRGTVDPEERLTFYTRWGDVIARVAIFLAVLLIAVTFTRTLLPAKS